MLFNSYSFVLFLPVAFSLFWLMPKRADLQNALIVLLSGYFYACWDVRAGMCVPLWTYSNGYDCVVTLVWYAVVAILAFGNASGVWLWYALFVGVGSLLRCCWVNGMQLGWFCPTGWGWIYAGTVMAMNWAMLGMLIWLGITLPKTNLVNMRD